jgi:20S proteasome alpha/beta subunit
VTSRPRLPRRKGLTIAIGAKFEGGVVVCADTKVVATDGATHHGSKVTLSVNRKKMAYAIANAAEDGNAAKMLSGDLSSAACQSENYVDLRHGLIEEMTKWYGGFGSMKPPALHFLLSAGGNNSSALYFCEPPNTVLFISYAMAIGQGARPIEPFTESLFWGIPVFGVKSALLKLAYLMHVAKSEEGAACGGNTTTVVVSNEGTFAFVDNDEMKKAEELAERMDGFLGKIRQGLLGPSTQVEQETKISEFSKQYADLTKEAENLSLPSLEWLDKPWWGRKNKQTGE